VLRATAIDLVGRPLWPAGNARRIELSPTVFHYLIER